MNYTRGKFFVDTNVLVYAYDCSAGIKWTRASHIVASLWSNRAGIISTQVLQELFVGLTQKVRPPLQAAKARGIITDLLRWQLIVNDGRRVLGAIDLRVRYGLSFWDSLILAAAAAAKADFLLSEDFQDGQVFGSVTVLNPFLNSLHGH